MRQRQPRSRARAGEETAERNAGPVGLVEEKRDSWSPTSSCDRVTPRRSTCSQIPLANSLQARQVYPAQHQGQWLQTRKAGCCAEQLLFAQGDTQPARASWRTQAWPNESGAVMEASGHVEGIRVRGGDWKGKEGRATLARAGENILEGEDTQPHTSPLQSPSLHAWQGHASLLVMFSISLQCNLLRALG